MQKITLIKNGETKTIKAHKVAQLETLKAEGWLINEIKESKEPKTKKGE